MFKNYYEARNWLESFIPQTYSKKNLGLERISYLLRLLGNPQNKFKSIHVGGTSGKGSAAFYIAKLLQNATGYSPLAISNEWQKAKGKRQKIGLHLSPHLSYIGERMQINGKPIKSKSLINLIDQIRPIVLSMENSKVGLPSYFEILVAASFKYFAEEKVDFAVVEVGLGGRYDATNVLKPEVSVITNVGLDHTDILGKTIEKIAKEKAGIIKKGVPIITGSKGKALDVIKKMAKAKKASLITVNTQLGVRPLKSDSFKSSYIYKGMLRGINLPFVFFNGLLAIEAVSCLKIKLNLQMVKKAFKKGLEGRFEEVERGVILDGAHNVDKVEFLIRLINDYSDYPIYQSEVVLVLSFKKVKDWKKMVDLLIKNLPIKKVIATKFYAVTDMGPFAAVKPEVIEKYVRSVYGLQTTVYSNSQEAVINAIGHWPLGIGKNTKGKRRKPNSVVLVTGSLYLVGEARTLWHLPSF